MSEKLYNVGIYIRLSKENTRRTGNDSMSIETQQIMLTKFVDMMPGWVEKRTYIDNGASGGNFDRQGFRDMMTDIRNGIINLVLVKDLSRFGRNYLEAGKYLEEELPALGCRFVAFSDGIDTETGENDIMPFINAMNDHYLKSMSDKIKAAFQIKAQNGQKPVGIAPYGYIRNPADKSRLIIEETAAKMVKRIFEMRATGMGYNAITAILNNEEVPTPRLYYYQRQNREPQSNYQKDWQMYMVKRLLLDEQYLGHTIFGKSRSLSYRNSRTVPRSKDEWLKVPNTHEAIIEIDLWDKVQEINSERKKSVANAKKPVPSLFSGKLVCSDCQRNLVFHVTLREKLIGEYSDTNAISAKEQRKLKQELFEIELRTEALYESKVSGIISIERFSELINVSETRRKEIQDRLDASKQSSEAAKTKLNDIERWVRLIKENSLITEVDRELINSLVDKIVVGEKVKENGVISQDVKIFYKYVGLV